MKMKHVEEMQSTDHNTFHWKIMTTIFFIPFNKWSNKTFFRYDI